MAVHQPWQPPPATRRKRRAPGQYGKQHWWNYMPVNTGSSSADLIVGELAQDRRACYEEGRSQA